MAILCGNDRTNGVGRLAGGAVFLAVLLACLPLGAQFNPAGYINGEGWLALGPFTTPFGCGTQVGILTNHIPNSKIYCQYPEFDDEVTDYDATAAAANGVAYVGPTGPGGKPKWRFFDDGSLTDADLDCNMDAGTIMGVSPPNTDAAPDGVATFLATYVQYLGASPIDVLVCGNSDDGMQVWYDDQLVFSNNACRGRGLPANGACDDLRPLTVTPGVHRFMMGIWESGGGFGGSLGLRDFFSSVVITDSNVDWLFLGTDSGGIDPPICTELPARTVTTPGVPTACPPTLGGPMSVKITEALQGRNAATAITVVEEVTGTFTSDKVVPENGGTKVDIVPTGKTIQGYVTSWLLLGPYTATFTPSGDNPGVPAMQMDYLTDGTTTEATIRPKAGDTIETDFNGAAASTGLGGLNPGVINPGGVPTWAAWYDADDTIDFNGYYGGDVDQIMMYAVTYVNVEADVDVALCLGSDDGIEVQIDGEIVWDNSIPRGWGVGCQDTVDLTATFGQLTEGNHMIMVKVFEGAGGHGFRLRLQDPATGEPAEGIGVCLVPGQNPCQLISTGTRITWNTTLGQLDGAGVGYKINVDEGTANFSGKSGGRTIVGTPTFTVYDTPEDYGPIANPPFAHAHTIGVPCPNTGVENPSAGTIVITGAGVDIWGTADQFMYAYSPVTGDFSAEVLITGRQMSVNEWAKHGIMCRENCSPGSRYFYCADQQSATAASNATNVQWRNAQDAAAEYTGSPLPAGTHSDRLRVDRSGSEFVGYCYDVDGSLSGVPDSWVELGRRDWGPDAPETIQLGLAVCSHDDNVPHCDTVTVTFEDWSVVSGGPVRSLVCTATDTGVDLTWENSETANPAVPISIRVNDVEVLTVAGTATSATVPLEEFPEGQISMITVVNSTGIGPGCTYPDYFNMQGFIKKWLLLGPYKQPGAALTWPNPGEANIRKDHLTDGAGIDELTVEPKAGDTVNTAYGPAGPARSIRLEPTPLRPDINPGGVPTWAAWTDPDDTINFSEYYGNAAIDGVMMYAVAYLEVEEELTVRLGLASDDAVQVLLDGTEIWINNIARAAITPANAVQDIAPALADPALVLDPGRHMIMVKVFEGGGDHVFRLRLQDDAGIPVTSGYKVTLGASGPPQTKFRRGDSDGKGGVPNITDGIYVLNFLFLGGPEPPCYEAANADDKGGINITDGIYILNYLFQGGPAPPAPGPDACGPEPAGSQDNVGCATSTADCKTP